MSEGPECHIDAAHLNYICRDAKILHVDIADEKRVIGVSLIEKDLIILGIVAYGKRIIFQMTNDVHFITSQHMNGKWQLHKQKKYWILLTLELSSGHQIDLSFRDDEMMSHFLICNKQTLETKLAKIGPDLLCVDIDLDYLTQALQATPKKNICAFLLSQKFFSGIGNYLKAEILYMSKICPQRSCGSLTGREIATMHYFMHLCIRVSYSFGGLLRYEWKTIIPYQSAYVPAIYQRDFTYSGNPVYRETIAGSVTYYCPTEQF